MSTKEKKDKGKTVVTAKQRFAGKNKQMTKKLKGHKDEWEQWELTGVVGPSVEPVTQKFVFPVTFNKTNLSGHEGTSGFTVMSNTGKTDYYGGDYEMVLMSIEDIVQQLPIQFDDINNPDLLEYGIDLLKIMKKTISKNQLQVYFGGYDENLTDANVGKFMHHGQEKIYNIINSQYKAFYVNTYTDCPEKNKKDLDFDSICITEDGKKARKVMVKGIDDTIDFIERKQREIDRRHRGGVFSSSKISKKKKRKMSKKKNKKRSKRKMSKKKIKKNKRKSKKDSECNIL